MKRRLLTLALAATMLAVATPATYAADNDETQTEQRPTLPNHGRQRMTREQFAEKQANYIAQQLAFDEKTTEQFVEVYKKNQQEIWAANPRPPRPPKDDNQEGNNNNKPMERPNPEQQIKDSFAVSQRMLDIRQKYYKEYSKFLSQQQIQRMYEIEKQLSDRFAKRGRRDRTK